MHMLCTTKSVNDGERYVIIVLIVLLQFTRRLSPNVILWSLLLSARQH